MFKKVSLLFVALFLTACGGSSSESEPKQEDVHGDGIVTSNEKNKNSVMLDEFIKSFDKVDNFDSDWRNAEIEESSNIRVNKDDGTEYSNIYIMTMDFTWQDKIYTVKATLSWEESDLDGAVTILNYDSSLGGYYNIETEFK